MSAISGGVLNKLYKMIDLSERIDDKTKEKTKALIRIRVHNFNKAVDDGFTAVSKEASKMYDSFIDQFYSYKTKSYIRHDETRPGTRVGINLYRANDIRFSLNNFELDLNINSNDMDGLYEHHKPSQVLKYVLSGHRFKLGDIDDQWRGSFKGKYIKTDEDVTINEAFDYLENNFDIILATAIRDRWR